MRLLFATKESYLPDVIGGGGLDTHHMVLTLRSQGHEATVIAARMREHRHLARRVRQKLARGRILVSRDTVNGYVTARAFYWQLAAVLEQQLVSDEPDVVVVQGTEAEQLALVAVRQGVPVLIRLMTSEGAWRLCNAAQSRADVAALLANPMVRVISNSRFIAAGVQARLGIASDVDYPLIDLADSMASNRVPHYVTFVNPRPFKGLDIALAVAARLPGRQFAFAESYPLSRPERADLGQHLAKLPNVTFMRHSPNLRSLYGQTAVLLMPSQNEEAFGRVVIEACANGIPVVASDIGGIPEAMGETGVLLAPSDWPQRWAEAIEEIMSDPELYARLSKAALANAERDELSALLIAERFLVLAKRHAATRS